MGNSDIAWNCDSARPRVVGLGKRHDVLDVRGGRAVGSDVEEARTHPGRAHGRNGGRKFALSKAQVRLAQASMAHRDTSVSALCTELGIKPVTLYRYVGPQGQLREQGEKVLAP